MKQKLQKKGQIGEHQTGNFTDSFIPCIPLFILQSNSERQNIALKIVTPDQL